MNLFGNSTQDGNLRLVQRISVASAIVAILAIAAAGFLDRAVQDGSLDAFASRGVTDPGRNMAGVPQSGPALGGVRYGNVDYMATATIPAGRQRVKNVVADPALGMPN